MRAKKALVWFLLAVVPLLAACSGAPTPDPKAVETQVAAKIYAEQTAAAPAPTPTPAGTDTPTPAPTSLACSQEARDFLAKTRALLNEWDDAERLAGSTARIALTQPIGQLQSLRRQADALDAPSCASKVKQLMTSYMDTTIDAYLAFMSQSSDEAVSLAMTEARLLSSSFREMLARAERDRPSTFRSVRFVAGGDAPFAVSYRVAGEKLGDTYITESMDNPWSLSIDVLNGKAVDISAASGSEGKLFCEVWIDGKLAVRQPSEQGGTCGEIAGSPACYCETRTP